MKYIILAIFVVTSAFLLAGDIYLGVGADFEVTTLDESAEWTRIFPMTQIDFGPLTAIGYFGYYDHSDKKYYFEDAPTFDAGLNIKLPFWIVFLRLQGTAPIEEYVDIAKGDLQMAEAWLDTKIGLGLEYSYFFIEGGLNTKLEFDNAVNYNPLKNGIPYFMLGAAF
ncbi:MAG: hypothetical protein FXF54_12435 [Kosmotoga sp.]|nr:MAG: hypothetical protein FXF54_12435 [Kosmotoga sp.]